MRWNLKIVKKEIPLGNSVFVTTTAYDLISDENPKMYLSARVLATKYGFEYVFFIDKCSDGSQNDIFIAFSDKNGKGFWFLIGFDSSWGGQIDGFNAIERNFHQHISQIETYSDLSNILIGVELLDLSSANLQRNRFLESVENGEFDISEEYMEELSSEVESLFNQ